MGRGLWRWPLPLRIVAIGLLALGFSVSVAQSDPALRGTIIATIDFDRVMRESSAGVKFREQLDRRYSQSEDEIKRMQAEVEQLRLELTAQHDTMTPEERQQRRNEFQQRKAEGFQLLQERKEQINRMFERGKQQIEATLYEVVREIAEEQGIDLVLNRIGPEGGERPSGSVLYTAAAVDIGEVARERLDARLPSIGLIHATD